MRASPRRSGERAAPPSRTGYRIEQRPHDPAVQQIAPSPRARAGTGSGGKPRRRGAYDAASLAGTRACRRSPKIYRAAARWREDRCRPPDRQPPSSCVHVTPQPPRGTTISLPRRFGPSHHEREGGALGPRTCSCVWVRPGHADPDAPTAIVPPSSSGVVISAALSGAWLWARRGLVRGAEGAVRRHRGTADATSLHSGT